MAMPDITTHRDFPPADELLSATEVNKGVEHLAAQLQPLIDEGNCVLLGVLLGGMFPLVRLAQSLTGDFLVDYCHASRYGSAMKGGELEWLREPGIELQNRTVIVVDDIFDEGNTFAAVADLCRQKGAARVLTAALVIKDRHRQVGIAPPDFDAGLHVPDRYVFGCGMDVDQHWRHLTAIYALNSTASEVPAKDEL
jgi:hypoxanthine phosphoribosyltransferase